MLFFKVYISLILKNLFSLFYPFLILITAVESEAKHHNISASEISKQSENQPKQSAADNSESLESENDAFDGKIFKF